MAYADIPAQALANLASERTRMYHALWHMVRSKEAWDGLQDQERAPLVEQGWTPPRFEGEPGAGIDFLFMHRRMIEMVNAWAVLPAEPGSDHGGHGGHGGHGAHGDQGGQAGGAQEHQHKPAQFVSGWCEVPWDHSDPVWPMPVVDLSDPELAAAMGGDAAVAAFARAKDPAITARYQQRCLERYNNRVWLRTVSLDALGTEMEFSIHGWFHMHWSPKPPPNPNTLDVHNDWLGSPFSSHVNKHFWKLHGWIDDRIKSWEDANGAAADLSSGWDGPPDYFTGTPHSADPGSFDVLGMRQRKPLMMPWKNILLEAEK